MGKKDTAKAEAVKASGAVATAAAEAGAAKETEVKKARPQKQRESSTSEPKQQVAPEAREKLRKPKLVRDSFTMPEAEYATLGEMKKACLKAGIEVKKSELLRVGIALLRELDTARLKEILDGLPMLKAGRPKKGK